MGQHTASPRDHRVGMVALGGGERLQQALDDLGGELHGATVGRPDETGIFEIALEADTFDDALARVWNAVAAAGADDQVAFAEHPDLPHHWQSRARTPKA